MARGTPGKKTASSKKSRVAEPPVAPEVKPAAIRIRPSGLRRLFRPRNLVLAAGLASLWLFYPLLKRQVPRLDDRPEYRIGPEQVTLNPPPRWIPGDLVQQVFERAGFSEAESLLDDTLSERVAAAFYTHPWIEDVVMVKKSFPARLQVQVVYREPVAMVKGVDGFYPIDRHAVLLPPGNFSVDDTRRYPVIEGVSTVPVGRLGEAWGDPVVAGAAELANVLIRETEDGARDSWWKKLELQAILVPRRLALSGGQDQLEYQLRTLGGSEILWGRAPTTRHPGELAVAQKLQRLTEYQRDWGGFNDQHDPYLIDIRPWHGIQRSLLARQPMGEGVRVH